jgi:hypothetical protein
MAFIRCCASSGFSISSKRSYEQKGYSKDWIDKRLRGYCYSPKFNG